MIILSKFFLILVLNSIGSIQDLLNDTMNKKFRNILFLSPGEAKPGILSISAKNLSSVQSTSNLFKPRHSNNQGNQEKNSTKVLNENNLGETTSRSSNIIMHSFDSFKTTNQEYRHATMLGAIDRQTLSSYDLSSKNSSYQPVNHFIATSQRRHDSVSDTSSFPNKECCLFLFVDGSAHYFDNYLRLLTGYYRLMKGTVNGHPHYVARGCRNAEQYDHSCSYIWNSGYGWIVGVGTYIGQTKGVIYSKTESICPANSSEQWRYLNKNYEWKDNGNVLIKCAS